MGFFHKTITINGSGKMNASIFVLPWTSHAAGYLVSTNLGKWQDRLLVSFPRDTNSLQRSQTWQWASQERWILLSLIMPHASFVCLPPSFLIEISV